MKGKQEITIQHPEVWQLLVSIEDGELQYILFTPKVANSLIIGEVACRDNSLQALEDAVYDTPELLNDYQRVRVVVHPRHFVLLPHETTDADCASLLREAFPHQDGEISICPMPDNDVKMACLLPQGMQAFLGRTFNYPMVYPHLAPLCEHFKALGHDDGRARMFLHMTDNRLDLAIYRDSKLMCANSYPFTDAKDAAYFALAAWRVHELCQLTDELQLLGSSDLQATMTPMLREYVKHVIPAVYPAAAMRLGRNAMQAPFELILLALCE